MAGKLVEFYTYSTEHLSVSAGASDTQNLRIQADSQFKIQKLSIIVDDDNDSIVAPANATILLKDTSSGRDLMNQEIHVGALFGDGELPFIMPTPKILPSQSILTVKFTNIDSSATYNAYVNFIGQKIYQVG